jgi:hypothetical protein
MRSCHSHLELDHSRPTRRPNRKHNDNFHHTARCKHGGEERRFSGAERAVVAAIEWVVCNLTIVRV